MNSECRIGKQNFITNKKWKIYKYINIKIKSPFLFPRQDWTCRKIFLETHIVNVRVSCAYGYQNSLEEKVYYTSERWNVFASRPDRRVRSSRLIKRSNGGWRCKMRDSSRIAIKVLSHAVRAMWPRSRDPPRAHRDSTWVSSNLHARFLYCQYLRR